MRWTLRPETWRLALALVVLVTLCGCSRIYVMKLSSGQTITSAGKPKLKGARYYFKDAQGRQGWVPQSRVLEIAPASMAKEEKPMFKGTPVR